LTNGALRGNHPAKDVDGVTTTSFTAMAFGEPGFASCTPAGIMHLLDTYNVPLAARHAVVVGRSPILGKSLGMLLLARDTTLTYRHSKTTDLPDVVAQADILIAAVGRPELVRGDWIKPGAVVIDAGYNPGNIGDVGYDTASTRASLITPVPGGVGPMTIAVLLAQPSTPPTLSQQIRSNPRQLTGPELLDQTHRTDVDVWRSL
jgi:methylenetetrahydrofolate dehydrogenase (NADP+)/methenyltetrahydrofolate cyclohydrolase